MHTGPPLYSYMSKGVQVMECTRMQLRISSFRRDNCIMKKVRVVSLASDMPTGPPLSPYQILSNYLKQYGSYGLHKISSSWEITTEQRKSVLQATGLLVLLFIPTKYYQNISKGIKVTECTKMRLRTEGQMPC